MTQEQRNEVAREIVKNNIYLTLATTDSERPWTAPLFYCVDDDFNFYYISQMDSLHTQHLLNNPNVSFSIFDSSAKEGEGNGIQASGKSFLLEKPEEIKEALKYYKTVFVDCAPESFDGSKPYRLFKIVPEKIYILDSEAKTDKRVEVFL